MCCAGEPAPKNGVFGAWRSMQVGAYHWEHGAVQTQHVRRSGAATFVCMYICTEYHTLYTYGGAGPPSLLTLPHQEQGGKAGEKKGRSSSRGRLGGKHDLRAGALTADDRQTDSCRSAAELTTGHTHCSTAAPSRLLRSGWQRQSKRTTKPWGWLRVSVGWLAGAVASRRTAPVEPRRPDQHSRWARAGAGSHAWRRLSARCVHGVSWAGQL